MVQPDPPILRREYQIDGHVFAVTVEVPPGFSAASESTEKGTNECVVSEKMHIHVMHSGQDRLRIFFAAADNGTLPAESELKRLLVENGAKVFQELNASSLREGRPVRLLILELDAAEEEGTVLLYAGGFPPILLVRNGEFTLPGRSGIPCGVVPEHRVQSQYIDWQAGDAIVIYSAGTERTGDLRSIHEALAGGEMAGSAGPVIRVQFVS